MSWTELPGIPHPSKDPARGEGFTITRCWIYAAVDKGGAEGVVGFQTREGWLPAIATDEKRRDMLRPIVESIARDTGRTVRLICLSVREVIEEIVP